MSRIQLLGTPSAGVDEVVKALSYLHATPASGRFVTVDQVKRKLPDRTTTTDITTALASAEGLSYVTDNGSGGYQLTSTGITHSRSVRGSGVLVA